MESGGRPSLSEALASALCFRRTATTDGLQPRVTATHNGGASNAPSMIGFSAASGSCSRTPCTAPTEFERRAASKASSSFKRTRGAFGGLELRETRRGVLGVARCCEK